MNDQTQSRELVDQETGEVTYGLPVGYGAGNQSLAIATAMAQIDQQITTARAYPRSIDKVVKNILSLATLDEETAAECVYALPRGGKPIKGPSVRLAEIIQSQWGNNRVGTMVVHVDRIEKYIEAEGVFHDLETNAATSSRVRRRISDRQGRLLSDDMIIVTGNAASSIAKRNAILAGVPKAVWRRAYAAVESVLAGDIKTLSVRRENVMKHFAAFGVKPDQVIAALGLRGVDDIQIEHMPTLVGMAAALKSGESSVEEMFPVAKAAGETKTLAGKLDDLAKKGEPNTASTSNHATDERKADADTTAAREPGAVEKVADPAVGSGSATDQSQKTDPVEAARAAGRAGRANKLNRKAIPAEFRADDALRTAYLDAFDAGEEGA